jgi:copper chaperone CopZ
VNSSDVSWGDRLGTLAGMQRMIIDVPDLAEGEAAAAIAVQLTDMIGVDRAEVDAREGTVTVTYDEGWVGEAGLMGVIQDAGFTVPDAPVRPE